MTRTIETVIVSATGYVGGELLRLIASHPALELKAALSESQAGQPIRAVFPHLATAYPEEAFVAASALELGPSKEKLAVFSAANHGDSAASVKALLDRTDRPTHVVDLSADFRFETSEAYEKVYGHPHGAPELLEQFRCAVPEHEKQVSSPHVGHPGCFATAALLAIVPLLDARLVEPEIFVSGITGSTGSGRTPKDTTHHPLRHANLFAYNALAHRHLPEIESLSEKATGVPSRVHFVPHSGPFARGIHQTVQARLSGGHDQATVREAFASYYEGSDFVRVVSGMPRLKDIVGSNYAEIGVAVDKESVAVFSVIDNLLKGAASGGMQWMNRLLGLDEATGLHIPPPGWL